MQDSFRKARRNSRALGAVATAGTVIFKPVDLLYRGARSLGSKIQLPSSGAKGNYRAQMLGGLSMASGALSIIVGGLMAAGHDASPFTETALVKEEKFDLQKYFDSIQCYQLSLTGGQSTCQECALSP